MSADGQLQERKCGSTHWHLLCEIAVKEIMAFRLNREQTTKLRSLQCSPCLLVTVTRPSSEVRTWTKVEEQDRAS